MRIVTLPPAQNDLSFFALWDQLLFRQPDWRATSDRTKLALDLDEKLTHASQAKSLAVELTDAEHEALLQVMQLPGRTTDGPPALVRYYLRALRAVQDAETKVAA